MTNRFYDLNFSRLADGTIRLTQTDCGEDCIIDTHPEQLRYIVAQVFGQTTDLSGRVDGFARRIAVLTDKLQDIVCNKAFRTDLLAGGNGFEYLARLDALMNLALEFDGGRLEPEEHDESYPKHSGGVSKPMAHSMANHSVRNTDTAQLGLNV